MISSVFLRCHSLKIHAFQFLRIIPTSLPGKLLKATLFQFLFLKQIKKVFFFFFFLSQGLCTWYFSCWKSMFWTFFCLGPSLPLDVNSNIINLECLSTHFYLKLSLFSASLHRLFCLKSSKS